MDQEVDSMFDINDKVMDAPLEDKMKFSKGMVDGMYLGCVGPGCHCFSEI
jgi:hypothetical protein